MQWPRRCRCARHAPCTDQHNWECDTLHAGSPPGEEFRVSHEIPVSDAEARPMMQMAAGEAELLTMAVWPPARRQGLGRQLLRELIGCATAYRAAAIWLEVRVSNTAAVALYRQAGFADIGWRRGYYETPNGREDAIMMRLTLATRREKTNGG